MQIEEETKREADRKARNILAIAMGRLAGTHASETTTRLIELPGEEMKGRIIGREGRNIRALEALTGVDVIIDETPNAVVVSSFDGVRREVARLTLERLSPTAGSSRRRSRRSTPRPRPRSRRGSPRRASSAELEAGRPRHRPRAAQGARRLRFRTSYGQNVLDHLVECAKLAGVDRRRARRLGRDGEAGGAAA